MSLFAGRNPCIDRRAKTMKNEMTERDIKAVIRASETLEKLNKKYGQPHGANTAGIVFHAYESMGRQGEK